MVRCYQQPSGKPNGIGLDRTCQVHYLHVYDVTMLTIDIKELGGKNVLGGSIPGQLLFGKLISRVAIGPDSEPCFLDFGKIQLATSSYLRESVLAFQRWGIDRKPTLLTAIANINSETQEELEVALADSGGAMWVCTLARGRIVGSSVIGKFDQMQRETFELVRARGEVDAPSLAREMINGRKVSQTAWNNRLAALASRGVLMERQHSKTKIYRLVLKV